MLCWSMLGTIHMPAYRALNLLGGERMAYSLMRVLCTNFSPS